MLRLTGLLSLSPPTRLTGSLENREVIRGKEMAEKMSSGVKASQASNGDDEKKPTMK